MNESATKKNIFLSGIPRIFKRTVKFRKILSEIPNDLDKEKCHPVPFIFLGLAASPLGALEGVGLNLSTKYLV